MQESGKLEVQRQEIIGIFQRDYPEVFNLLKEDASFSATNPQIIFTVTNEGTAIISGE